MKKILSFVLIALLTLSMAAFAESDLQTQLDAANACIAELEAKVAFYEPYYTRTLAATYGDGKVITAETVLKQYNEVAAMYAQYGLDLVAYGMDGEMKKDILNTELETAIILDKAAELGLDQLTPEEEADINAQVEETTNDYYTSYIEYFYPDAEVTDDMMREAMDYWANNGLDVNALYEESKKNLILEKMEIYMQGDITLSEESLVQAYEAKVAEDEEMYASDSTAFVNDYCSGETIAWYPEGHRAVKQILIKFNDEQSARYSELQGQLSDLEAEREAVLNPEEAASEDETESTDETEEPAVVRTIEEIDADIAEVNAQIDALYDEITPKANEVVDAFNNGTDIEELIATYNEDPGMVNEPTASRGYAVSADALNWDPSFSAAAMSIESVGQLAEPARGSYGIYIVYYYKDLVPGPVALDEIRDELSETALDDLKADAYNAQLEAWKNEANITYYYENLGIVE